MSRGSPGLPHEIFGLVVVVMMTVVIAIIATLLEVVGGLSAFRFLYQHPLITGVLVIFTPPVALWADAAVWRWRMRHEPRPPQ